MAATDKTCAECIYQQSCDFNKFGINGNNCNQRYDFDECETDNDTEEWQDQLN